jgi:hypothetical protein
MALMVVSRNIFAIIRAMSHPLVSTRPGALQGFVSRSLGCCYSVREQPEGPKRGSRKGLSRWALTVAQCHNCPIDSRFAEPCVTTPRCSGSHDR